MSIRQLKALQKRILQLNLASTTWESAAELMAEFGNGYLSQRFKHLAPLSYRVRLNKEPGSFNSKDEIWAPPAEFIGAGRFNAKHESVLYLASTPLAALWEMRPKPRDRLTITAVTMPGDEHLLLHVIGLEAFRPTEQTGPLSEFAANGLRGAPGFADRLRALGIEERWLIQNDLFGHLATKWFPPGQPAHHYKLTVPIWQNLVRGDARVHGLMYPSVRHNLHAFNVALKPDMTSSAFRPLEAWEYVVDDVADYEGPGEPKLIGRVTRRGQFRDDDTIDWHSTGAWLLSDVRAELRHRLGDRQPPPGLERLLRYSEEEIELGRREAHGSKRRADLRGVSAWVDIARFFETEPNQPSVLQCDGVEVDGYWDEERHCWYRHGEGSELDSEPIQPTHFRTVD